jgi:DNA polymerase-1
MVEKSQVTTPTHIVCDTHNLAFRAYHAVPNLTFDDVGTSVAFGVFREVLELRETFGEDSVFSFCFDVGRSNRVKDDPRYKDNRQPTTEEEKVLLDEVREQITRMRDGLLQDAGFQNIFWAKGFEADDLIATVCDAVAPAEVIIVSSDKDLYQLLSPRVMMFPPAKRVVYTESCLMRDFGVRPDQWSRVKAIAGCPGDNVIGLAGIGEKKASQYLTRAMGEHTATFKRIRTALPELKKNHILTKIPYPGTPICRPNNKPVDMVALEKVCKSLGFSSFRWSRG